MAHLARRAAEDTDHMAGRRMFEAFQAVADPLDHVDLVVENNGELEAAVDAVCAYLAPRLG